MRLSERFDKWINLHGVVQRMDETEAEESLFSGTSEFDDDNLVGEIERRVQRAKNPHGQMKPGGRE